MSHLKNKMTELAELMAEFGLAEARLAGDDWSIEFSKNGPAPEVVSVAAAPVQSAPVASRPAAKKPQPATQKGTPISSPMTGIYYSSPSPGQPPFVKLGDTVTAGQVVGLIEAMKVYNEMTATISGTVLKIAAENGQLVNPGDPILFVG